MNCPDASTLVTNEGECRTSAAKVGRTFGSVGCLHTEISGCFDNGKVYFSQCAKGSTRYNHAPVCKQGEYFAYNTPVHNTMFYMYIDQ